MITNQGNISLPMAIWLAADEYDHDPSPNVISATELLKAPKQIILSGRAHATGMVGDSDLQDNIASSIGTAIHNAVEHAVKNLRTEAMIAMGIPPRVRDLIRINPPVKDPAFHNIYMERRVKKELDGFIISGKYDIIENGRVKDIKSTKVYSYIYGTNNTQYGQQGSIYRWLNPTLITDEFMDVEFVFTDWLARDTKEKGYPPLRVMSKTVPLMTIPETEMFIRDKLKLLVTYQDRPEAEMPECSRAELWQKPTTWAYFKNPLKKKRATKVYYSSAEAMARQIEDGSVGVTDTRPGKAKHCLFCAAKPICAQAERLQTAGLLE